MPEKTLTDLPNELLELIVENLHGTDLLELSKTNQHLKGFLDDETIDNTLWQKQLQLFFPKANKVADKTNKESFVIYLQQLVGQLRIPTKTVAALKEACPATRDMFQVASIAAQSNSSAIILLSCRLKADIRIILQGMKTNRHALAFGAQSLQDNPVLLQLAAIEDRSLRRNLCNTYREIYQAINTLTELSNPIALEIAGYLERHLLESKEQCHDIAREINQNKDDSDYSALIHNSDSGLYQALNQHRQWPLTFWGPSHTFSFKTSIIQTLEAIPPGTATPKPHP